MQNLYLSVEHLDSAAIKGYALSSELLMEHAALALANEVRNALPLGASVLGVVGSGDNGADVVAAMRILEGEYRCSLYLASSKSSKMLQLQLCRAKAVGVEIVEQIHLSDGYLDGLLGSGLNRELSDTYQRIIKELNGLDGYKIACDFPSGIGQNGTAMPIAFRADVTVAMGGLKAALFMDGAKEYCAEVKSANLGVAKSKYQIESDIKLLEATDLRPPYRNKPNLHKGSFGHLEVIGGDKLGAANLCAQAALRSGAGLVSITGITAQPNSSAIMSAESFLQNPSAIAVGMGLMPNKNIDRLKEHLLLAGVPILLDADMFYLDITKTLIKSDKALVLTPHPKEFCALYEMLLGKSLTIKELQSNRLAYLLELSCAYKKVVFYLKGANPLIAQDKKVYINPLGTSRLAKAGSGDVLSGIIASLLAQGYSPLDAAIHGSLMHTLAAKCYKGADFSMGPCDLIDSIGKLDVR